MSTSALQASVGSVLDPRQTPSKPGSYPRAGMAMRFHVALDESEIDLGMWASCRGLQVQFSAKEITEGGEHFAHTMLPDRVKFSPVTLERVMTQADSPKIQQWLSQVAAAWTGYEYGSQKSEYTGQNLTIRLFDYQGRVVSMWVLKNAFPKEWTGPELNAQSSSVATEKISFEHSGFLT
ncbi:phage tail protein [Streptomyces sp. NPDC051014]|uniref:phage tail protein n=1 Tax=Streptomyces sp. NPDC051014 TaxID=3155751 RepID=UPI0033D49847